MTTIAHRADSRWYADGLVTGTNHGAEIASYLFENARDIILVIDAPTGAILDVNRAAETAYGYSRDEFLQMAVFELRVEPAAYVSDQMAHAQSTGVQFETLHRRRDGSIFPVEVSSRGDVIGGRQCLFSIVRDITARKRLESERERSLEETQQALAVLLLRTLRVVNREACPPSIRRRRDREVNVLVCAVRAIPGVW